MRTWVGAVLAVSGLVVGGLAVSGVYEAGVVPKLTGNADALATVLGDALGVVDACQTALTLTSDTVLEISDQYEAARAATDDFFDRYSYQAGDATYLYANLFATDDGVSSALSAVTGDRNVTQCYDGF